MTFEKFAFGMKFEKDGANGHVEKIKILILMNTGLNSIQPHN